MSIFDETSLDQLHALTAKRLAAIREEGADFTLVNSEKAFKGIMSQDRKCITFDPATPAHIGAQFEHTTGAYIVLTVTNCAGCKQCDVAAVTGSASVYQKAMQRGPGGAVVALSPAGVSLPILKDEGHRITTPLRFGSLRGAVLKTTSGFMEVTGAFIRGPVVELQVSPYQEPKQKALPGGIQRPDYLDRAPAKAPWSSAGSFSGW